jgi:hypothetical protein
VLADAMDEIDPHEEIARLEERMEELAGVIASCRKIIFASRAALAGGALLLAAMLLGAVGFDPLMMIAAITAVIGGIVLLGTNRSTLEQSSAALKSAEAERAALIGRIELRVINGGAAWDMPPSRTLH